MGSWSHIILEGFCLYKPMSKKIWKTYKGQVIKKDLKFSKDAEIKNKSYIPKKEIPRWCRKKNTYRIPQFKCLGCPFFAYVNARQLDYKQLFKRYQKQS